MRRLRCLAAAGLVLGLAGCGDGLKRVPVEGKLTAGGQPLGQATVQFLPTNPAQGQGGMGRSDDGGNFTLIGSRDGARGVVPGEYKVRLSRLVARDGTPLPADAKQADHPGARESIPGPYTSPDGTPLRVTVPEAGGPVTVAIPERVPGQK
jgi:hypothetical protein